MDERSIVTAFDLLSKEDRPHRSPAGGPQMSG